MRFVVFREPRSGVRAPDAGESAGRGRAACGGRRPRSGLRPRSGPRGPMRRSRPPVVRAFVLARGARRRSLAALRFRPRFNIDLFQNRLSSTPQPRKYTGLFALRESTIIFHAGCDTWFTPPFSRTVRTFQEVSAPCATHFGLEWGRLAAALPASGDAPLAPGPCPRPRPAAVRGPLGPNVRPLASSR